VSVKSRAMVPAFFFIGWLFAFLQFLYLLAAKQSHRIKAEPKSRRLGRRFIGLLLSSLPFHYSHRIIPE
jgi:hypothetical protein